MEQTCVLRQNKAFVQQNSLNYRYLHILILNMFIWLFSQLMFVSVYYGASLDLKTLNIIFRQTLKILQTTVCF